MRILAHGPSLPLESRLALAAAGLAMRGHEVLWAGSPATRDDVARLCAGHVPEGLRVVAPGLALARLRVDVALGSAASPLAPALAGMLAHAGATVLELSAADHARWGVTGQAVWEAVGAWALVPGEDAAALQHEPRGLDLGRLAPWSDDPAPAHADPAHADAEVLERACERALARRRGHGLRPAVFLDRDGTLVVERGYLSDPGGLEVLPGVAGALRRLRAAGFALVVVSNQAGVGRGMFPLARVYATMARLRAQLRVEGAEPDAIWFCPHRPEDGCACRKPGIALLERAAEDLQLDLRASFMVGDKLLDARTGANAGARGVLVRTGYGREEEALIGPEGAPARVCDGLGEAADWILRQLEPGA